MIKNKYYQGFSSVIVLVIAGIILAGIVGVIMMRKPSPTSAPSAAMDKSTDATTESAIPTGDTTSTFPDIIGRGQNLECDWKLPTAGPENPFGTGKLYTTGSKGRSEIAGTTNGIAIEADVIYKDDSAYTWITVAGTTTGFKFSKAELESMSTEMTAERKQQAEQIKSEMIFSCKSWTPDESKFALPTGVEFK